MQQSQAEEAMVPLGALAGTAGAAQAHWAWAMLNLVKVEPGYLVVVKLHWNLVEDTWYTSLRVLLTVVV